MLPKVPTNVGIDSQATIVKGTTIIEHETKRRTTRTRNDDGALLLGGEVSPYHRESPWKRCWKLMKDGDLWGSFQKAVAAKNPEAVKLTKVKGHATSEMVQQGAVRFDDKHGNDQADIAAEKGATLVQPMVRHFARFYEKRHSEYVKFISRVQTFIVKVKQAEKDMRDKTAKDKKTPKTRTS